MLLVEPAPAMGFFPLNIDHYARMMSTTLAQPHCHFPGSHGCFQHSSVSMDQDYLSCVLFSVCSDSTVSESGRWPNRWHIALILGVQHEPVPHIIQSSVYSTGYVEINTIRLTAA